MAFWSIFGPDRKGLSKKYDSPHLRPASLSSMRLPWTGIRRRRVLLALVAIVATYLFIHFMPDDLGPSNKGQYSIYDPSMSGYARSQFETLGGHRPVAGAKPPGKIFDGPVRFLKLADTLRASFHQPYRENIVFVVLHLHSVPSLLPLACQMRKRNLNSIHIVLMGKSSATPEDIMTANGLTLSDCPIQWHDARPDFALESSEGRILRSITAGYQYIQQGLEPRAVLTEEKKITDKSLVSTLEAAAAKHGIRLIKLPTNAVQSMSWLGKLEPSSISSFGNVDLEIVIQAYSESAGTLIRLLRSLRNANYDGVPVPRLTIELPSRTDPLLTSYLSKFKWPPNQGTTGGLLTVRKRINLKQITPAEASLRTIETFYPSSPATSHIVMLSPDVEVSPNFMHYLMFTTLEFKYGRRSSPYDNYLFGISLHLPQKELDGSQPFLTQSDTTSSPFVLSQSPNSNAALYFGAQWVEFHHFLSRRLAVDPQLKSNKLQNDLKVSQDYPQWVKHAAEFMRARGLFMLYPAFAKPGQDQITIVHQELHRGPEEFADLDSEPSQPSLPTDGSWLKEGIILGNDDILEQSVLEAARTDPNPTLPSVLVGNDTSLEYHMMPSIGAMTWSATGETFDWPVFDESTTKYAEQFSIHYGACKSLDLRDNDKTGSIDFLFCELNE